jgi:hypothetical protein
MGMAIMMMIRRYLVMRAVMNWIRTSGRKMKMRVRAD